jgi:Transglutaminase-like superfamily
MRHSIHRSRISPLYFSFQSEGGILEMLFLILWAYIELIHFDLYVSRGTFAVLYQKVRDCEVRENTAVQSDVERICSAVDLACIWYWKKVLCLQRSAATACLLKRHGVPARMVIGAQQIPFKAHAWVEVNGRVVNDKPYTAEMYAVLDRC